jgi:hypothetical protein
MSLDLNKLTNNLDEALSNETTETLTKFLNDKRMSNNKQQTAVKLYTEEQVMKTWNTAFIEALQIDNDDYKAKYYDDFIKELTPIELPSDEEIEDASLEEVDGGHYDISPAEEFQRGAKYVIDKIQ